MATFQLPAAPQVVSPFPAPPSYAKLYTREDVAANKVLPPPPVPNDFIVFGEEYHLEDEIIRPLPAQGIRQLYSNKSDWKDELKKLNRSVVAAFLDLLDILIRCPEHPDRAEKINDIRDIFINIHHLINEYRPIQARDSLLLTQSRQLKELERVMHDFKQFTDQTSRTLLTGLAEQHESAELKPIPPRRPEIEETESGSEEEDAREKVSVNAARLQRRRVRAAVATRREREAALYAALSDED